MLRSHVATLPKAVLFDLDDTILSLGGREALLLKVVEEFADSVSPIPPSDLAEEIEAAFLEFWAVPGRYSDWRTRLLDARIMVVERLFAERPRSPQLAPDLARRIATRFHERRESDQDRLFPRRGFDP